MIFRFSGLLLRFVDYDRTTSVTAATLGEALQQLHERYPELRPILWNHSGDLTKLHRLVLNGELLEDFATDMPLAEEDRVEFLTAVAGG